MTDVRLEDPTTTQSLTFDRPEAYLAGDRRRALAAGTELPDRVHGAALFADISGFTPLTEALAGELGPQRGAEELTAYLNLVFHAVIEELDRYGGDVIYFGGDAITCWLDGDDGSRATACALAMQETMERVGEIVTPAGTGVRLAMKVAVAVGRGSPLRRRRSRAPADRRACRSPRSTSSPPPSTWPSRGEVVLEQSALDALGDRVQIGELRLDDDSGRTVGVVTALTDPAAELPAAEPRAAAPRGARAPLAPAGRLRAAAHRPRRVPRRAAARDSRLRALRRDRLRRGRRRDRKLDDFVRRAQRIFADYGGNVLQITIGDKGAYLYAVFGSPHAHEDDARARCVCRARSARAGGVTAATDLQIGIANGRLRSGSYGHAMRRTFVCLGDAVNLAARLMSTAPPGQAYVAESARQLAGESFTWKRLPELTVKGKDEPSRPTRSPARAGAAPGGTRRTQLEIVGRRDELAALSAAARAHGRAGRARRRHLGGGGRRQVAPRGGVRPRRACRRRLRRLRRVSSVRHERRLRRLARDLAQPASRRRRPAGRTTSAARSSGSWRRSILRSCRARRCSARCSGIAIPDNELTAVVRREAAQGVAGGAPRRLPAGARGRGAARRRARGLPLDRPALARPARRARRGRPRRCRCCSCSPTGRPRSRAAGSGSSSCRSSASSRSPELEPADAELLIRSKLAQLFGGGAEASPDLVDARDRTLAGQPLLPRGAPQLHPRARRRSPGRRGASRPGAAGEPPQPHPQPRRHARRGAAAHAQGRERGRTHRSSPGRSRRSIRSSARRTTSASTSPRCARAT